MAQVTEADYRKAQQGDARVRQEFLNAIYLEDAREFIREITYHPCDTFEQTRGQMVCLFPAGKLIDSRHRAIRDPLLSEVYKSKVVVLPSSFDFSIGQFLSCLIDHEGFHARQYCERPEDVWFVEDSAKERVEKQKEIMSTLEVPAYFYQMRRQLRRGAKCGERVGVYTVYRFPR